MAKAPTPKEKVLVIRTSAADGTSYNKFKWPALGPVECPDWDPAPKCGNGLHGLVWGDGDWSFLSNATMDALWQVVEVDADLIVAIDKDKVKFPRGVVVYSGDMATAVKMVLANEQRILATVASISKEAQKKSKVGGRPKQTAASSGNSSTATAKGKGTIAMVAGIAGKASAGANGCFALAWYDSKAKRNRIAIGYVGEDGIKADTLYAVNSNGELTEVR